MRLSAGMAVTLLISVLTPPHCQAQFAGGFSSFRADPWDSSSAPVLYSPEAQEILESMESVVRAASTRDPKQMREVVDNVRSGYASYKKIGEGVYLIQRNFELHLLDIRAGKFEELLSAYDLEPTDAGTLRDGTGWVLARSGRLSRGVNSEVYYLVTYMENAAGTKVVSAPLAGESTGYSEDGGTRADYCGDSEDLFSGLAGKIESLEWKDVDNDDQPEIAFRISRFDCDAPQAKPYVVERIFEVARGEVQERL